MRTGLLSNPRCRPLVFHRTGGQVHDIVAAPELLAITRRMKPLLGDKGYDGDDFRARCRTLRPARYVGGWEAVQTIASSEEHRLSASGTVVQRRTARPGHSRLRRMEPWSSIFQ